MNYVMAWITQVNTVFTNQRDVISQKTSVPGMLFYNYIYLLMLLKEVYVEAWKSWRLWKNWHSSKT